MARINGFLYNMSIDSFVGKSYTPLPVSPLLYSRMDKNLKPVMGQPAEACLREIKANLPSIFEVGKLKGRGDRVAVADEVISLINVGICLKESQVKAVRSWFVDFNSDPFGNAREMASTINRFDLTCENCLCDNCGQMRDCSVLVEDVRARAKEWNETLPIVRPVELSIKYLFPDQGMPNLLARNDIKTCADLLEKTESDLLGMTSFGERSLRKVKKALTKVGLTLKGGE